ncbi:uncharacterized protein LOC123697422 [Colias croceus]|uniref:uncharacterized protein LOC123697422 n=1 Tax=Colias crocea TaxID=72248 RepID=UPI001E27C267|nr:uncharacterized protein LOC123697422 [Colias croceus]
MEDDNCDNDNLDTNTNNSNITFDNMTILNELNNIANLVRNEDFLETVPNAKLKRLKWVPMFNYLKQYILDEMVQELGSMWDFENMSQKLEILEQQKDKFSKINPDKLVWRPQHLNIKDQLRAKDAANLRKQKASLESLAKEYELRVVKLKKKLTAKRCYFKALQMDIQKYEKKNEEIINKIAEKIETHSNLVEIISPNTISIDNKVWSVKENEFLDN